MPERRGRVYSEIFLHFVWHTKDGVPFIDSAVRPRLYGFLTTRIAQSEHAHLVSIGGTRDHVHLCIRADPQVAPADVVKDLKGASAHHINHLVPPVGQLQWQRGYGVLSLGKRNVPWLERYIASQEEHHARGTAVVRLECTEGDEESG